MELFDLGVSERDAAGGDAIDTINRAVINALVQRIKERSMTKSGLAKKLECNRAAVSRLLRGNQNLTARTIGEILWALDFDLASLNLKDLAPATSANEHRHTGARASNFVVVAKSDNGVMDAPRPVSSGAALRFGASQ